MDVFGVGSFYQNVSFCSWGPSIKYGGGGGGGGGGVGGVGVSVTRRYIWGWGVSG